MCKEFNVNLTSNCLPPIPDHNVMTRPDCCLGSKRAHAMDPEQETSSRTRSNNIMDEIPDYKRSMATDVEIFVAGSPNPIRTSALLLADSSPMLASLLHQISYCAGRADFLSELPSKKRSSRLSSSQNLDLGGRQGGGERSGHLGGAVFLPGGLHF